MSAARPDLLGLLWRRFSLRHARRSPGATLVLVLILALGVAVFYSVRLANRAAVTGFIMFTEAVTGEADLTLSSPAGRLPESVLTRARERLGNLPVALFPVLEASATQPGTGSATDGFDARQFQILGLDLAALRNLPYLRPDALPSVGNPPVNDEDSLLGSARRAWISPGLAKVEGLKEGERLEVFIADHVHALEIAGILESSDLKIELPPDLIVMDLPGLQRAAGMEGWIDRIEVLLPDGPDRVGRVNEAEDLLGRDPDSWNVQRPETRRESASDMTAAFRLNLTILSGLALLVGMYLALQALEAAVVRRRLEIGILRSLGFENRWIRQAWLIESLALGILGSALGLVMGYLGAQAAVGGIARSVNALYYHNTTTAAGWHHGEAALAFALGVLASLAAGWLPARDAASTPPAQALGRSGRTRGIRLWDHPLLGVALIGIGVIAARLPPLSLGGQVRFPAAGYVGAVCWLVGASIVFGAFFPIIGRILAPLGAFSAAWRYAVSQLRRPTGRHKLATAGLVVAVGMAAGMDILIHSFDLTMRGWIGQSLSSDLYIACRGIGNASNRNQIGEETWRALAADPDVAFADVTHFFPVEIGGGPTWLAGARLSRPWAEQPFVWIKRPRADTELDRPMPLGAWPSLASESFSVRYQVDIGDRVDVPTTSGSRQTVVVGIFADYGNERGSLVVNGEQASDWFGDARARSLAVHVKPGVDPENLRQRWANQHPALSVRSSAHLREQILLIFRQTFSITYALKSIGVAVAVAGLALALVGLLLERRRELATLREVGATRRQIVGAVMIEGVAVAGVGLAGGLVVSMALGWMLIFVINKQSFGWTLGFAIPWAGLALLAAMVLAAALAASALTGRWGSTLRGEQEE